MVAGKWTYRSYLNNPALDGSVSCATTFGGALAGVTASFIAIKQS